MKVLFLVPIVVFAHPLSYPCPVGQYLSEPSSTTTTTAGCCTELFHCADYDGCTASQYTTDEYTFEDIAAYTCCGPRTCNAYGTAGATSFSCPAGKVASNAPIGAETPDEELCCAATNFTKTCYQIELQDVMNLFDCEAEGLVFDQDNILSTTLDAETCCTEFVATCAWTSGSILAQVKHECPAGKVFDDANGGTLSPSDAKCCTTYVVTCGFTNDAGEAYECPVVEAADSWDLEDPDEEVCCADEATCGNYGQVTCGDVDLDCEAYGDFILGPLSVLVGGSSGSRRAKFDFCCIPAPDNFGGASSVAVASLTFLAVLL